MPEITEAVAAKASQIQVELNAATETARSNGALTTEGRERALAVAYMHAKTAMDDLVQSWQGTSEATASVLAKDLFGAVDVRGADAISLRDAGDRASQVETPEAALALLDRANNTGDEVLARAVAEHAWLQRSTFFGGPWRAVVDAYAVTRKDVAVKLAELDAASTDDIRANLTAGFMFILAKPAELDRHSDYRIQMIAETDLPVASRQTQADLNREIGRTTRQSSGGYDWLGRHQGLR